MKNKKSLTESILNNIVSTKEVKLDLNSFIMVPINHPRISEIMYILNTTMKYDNKENINLSTKENDNKIKDNKIKDNKVKAVITLKDVMDKVVNNKIYIRSNSIISPLARDYIKENKIEVITYNEVEE